MTGREMTGGRCEEKTKLRDVASRTRTYVIHSSTTASRFFTVDIYMETVFITCSFIASWLVSDG